MERMRMLYEVVKAGVPVIMSDLDAIWVKDALSDIQVGLKIGGSMIQISTTCTAVSNLAEGLYLDFP
jgi:hypothetical protein